MTKKQFEEAFKSLTELGAEYIYASLRDPNGYGEEKMLIWAVRTEGRVLKLGGGGFVHSRPCAAENTLYAVYVPYAEVRLLNAHWNFKSE